MPISANTKKDINRLYKLILDDAKELDKVFSKILNTSKYERLSPNVKQWIEWVGIARKMAKSACTTGVGIPDENTAIKYYAIQNNINNITGLHPATHEKICGLVSQISSLINEIIFLYKQNGRQESDDEVQPQYCPVTNDSVKK
ncbi:hypothetical protein G9409_04410 [Chlorobium sp. BLA1]|uniref:hypothetical protein n=1 Tax=Candidatus Chlorobium masyuteum TaxID=2716876 RepID=UPI001420A8FD|nr:hypothetical protein [Candidatus Chlorobium masyuteum]NHQ59836.1 hypothetical protein [Candidatus Chlorobium masyuteum]